MLCSKLPVFSNEGIVTERKINGNMEPILQRKKLSEDPESQ